MSQAVVTPAARPHIASLDALRGLAALFVVGYHIWQLSLRPGRQTGFAWFIGTGYLSVDVFFTLSGLVLFLPMARREGDPGLWHLFLVRRFTRLWPCYAVALGLGFLAAPTQGLSWSQLPPHSGGWSVVVSHALLLPTFTGLQTLGFRVTPVVWTIAAEFCFGLVLPVVARAYYRHPWRGLVIAATISRGWDFACTQWFIPRQFHVPAGGAGAPLRSVVWLMALPAYAAQFAVGMTVATLIVTRHETIARLLPGPRAALLAGISAVCFVGVAVVLSSRLEAAPGAYSYAEYTGGWPLLLPLAPLLLGLCYARGRLAAVLGSRPIQILAGLTFPLYLVHMQVLKAVQLHSGLAGWREAGILVCCLVPALVLCQLLHVTVELPALNWGKRITSRTGPPARLGNRGHPAAVTGETA